MKHTFRAFHALATQIDAATGVIKGVKIMSIGACKGHGMMADEVTLEQLVACIKTYKTGLKVKFNPTTFNHGDGSIAGIIPVDTVKIENGVAVGDLRLLANYPHRAYILEMAETMPDTFGLSIDYSGENENIGGTDFSRVSEIYAVTIVDEPAANDGLFFSALPEPPTKKQAKPMDEEQMKALKAALAEANGPLLTNLAALQESQKGFADRLTKLESKLAASGDETEPSTEGMSDEEKESELAMAGVLAEERDKPAGFKKLHAYRRRANEPLTMGGLTNAIVLASTQVLRTVGHTPVGGTGNGSGPAKGGGGGGGNNGKHSFMVKVDEAVGLGIDRGVATSQLAQKYPEEFKSFRQGQEAKLGKR